MLSRTFGLTLILWILSALSTLSLFFPIREKDRQIYLAFLAKEHQAARIQNQMRDQVCKDLYLYKEDERCHIQIACDRSELIYDPVTHVMDETLHHIDCVIDERDKRQHLRSDLGHYHYKNLSFTADEVDIDIVSAATLSPLLSGHARALFFSMKHGFEIETKQFKAHVVPQRL